MKKIILTVLFFVVQLINAQNFDLKVNISYNHKVKNYEIVKDDFHFIINDNGVLEHFYSSKTDNTFEYYDNNILDNSDFGKLKKIGNSKVDYWNDQFANLSKFGKLKTIGNIRIDYWDNNILDQEKYQKIKTIGDVTIDYYDNKVLDSSDFGKIKKIGNFKIEYYNNATFDQSKFGKIKSIGNTSFDYYENTFNNVLDGKLKSTKGQTSHLSLIFE